MVEPILHVDDVSVHFGGVTAVDHVSLRVAPGERWAVIGPNGAGKTTLFRAISGEVYPSDGRIHLFGTDMSQAPPYRKAQKGLGRTYQITDLFKALSVEENLAIATQARSMSRFIPWRPLRIRGWIDERISAVLQQVGLGDQRNHMVSEMSHGEQRQLEIAMALAGDPSLLLLDEPGAGLSAAERRIMRELISSLSRDLTIVLIEHDMSIALELVEQVLVLDNGRPIAEGDPEAIRRDQRVQDVYLKSD
ncbi:MAG: ABC transporter ATP-binding protein [Acidimicrobiia bacterium]